jgi:hypothetical protein
VNIKSTCKDYTKSRKQQQGHLHCFSASTFPVISSSSRQASVAPNCWSCLGILSGTNSSPNNPPDQRLKSIFSHMQVILFHAVVCDVKYPYSSQTREPKECFVIKTRELATFYSPAVNKVRKYMQIFSP